MKGNTIDPVYRQWRKAHPKFPGVGLCIELLGRSNTQGSKLDIICTELKDYGERFPGELIDAFRALSDPRIRLIVLGVIEDIESSDATRLFAEILDSDREEERSYAMNALRALDTKESRAILWNAENR